MKESNIIISPLIVKSGDETIKMKYSVGVMMPSPFSLFLAEHLPTRGAKKAVDIGCGSGFQAILLAKRGVADVLAIDIDARCVAASDFNCLLNGVSRWSNPSHGVMSVQGDLFAPAEGERFDLIVCNPPTLPESEYTPAYANGGKDGREIIDRLICESADKLSPNGKLVFVESSLTDMARTERLLKDNGFKWKVIAKRKVRMREFYLPHYYFIQRMKDLGKASFLMDRKGDRFEVLSCIEATLAK